MITATQHVDTLPFSRLSGVTRLFLDFLSGRGDLKPFLGAPFDDEAALASLVEGIGRRDVDREHIVRALEPLARDVDATDAARANLEALGKPDTLVVFAGQQTGLFTGPLYTIYKALTVEGWAARLSEQLGRTVVPCFWLSTDDHDYDEVDHVQVPSSSHIQTIRYTPGLEPKGDPVGRILLDSGIERALEEYSGLLPDTEFKSAVFDTLRGAYVPGRRFSSAFGRLWYAMFPQSGLVMVSPCQRDFKELAAPFLERALVDDETLFELYADASERLEAAGYHRQVHKSRQQTFLFYQQFKRHSIHTDEQGGYVWEGAEPVTRDWLLRMIRERPDYFSSNVLLRPVLQNGIFPTLGVVLGPSELAYYAQIGGIHDHFGVARPLIMPRTSATLLEKSVRKRIAKHGIELESLQRDIDAEVARVLRATFPQDLETQFDRAEHRIGEAFDAVRPGVAAFDPTLDKPLRMAAARARREMSQVAQRAHAAHKRKEEETEAQIRRLATQVFPEGGLQERTCNIVYYWARYGPDLLTGLYDHWTVGARAHVLWEL